eukprot:m.432920 g.432920  ORF g.432920 m.432920 type:complete len:80 (-) comp21415_c0_seq10:2034-2273(-)
MYISHMHTYTKTYECHMQASCLSGMSGPVAGTNVAAMTASHHSQQLQAQQTFRHLSRWANIVPVFNHVQQYTDNTRGIP